jgi:iron complex outermembrane receptor protein
VRDPIAEALGATPLKAETSHNYSVGAVLHPFDGLLVTGDWYEIDVANRIVLSNQLTGPAVSAILGAHGVTDVQQVQFFTNAAHTRTKGYEFTASYTRELGSKTTLDANLEYGQYRTALAGLAVNPVLPSLPLIAGTSQGLLLSAQPLDKLTSSVTLTHEPFAATFSVEHYGPWKSAPLGATQTFNDKTLFDLSGRFALTDTVWITAGVLNVTNVYPDLVIGGAALGLTYGEESPFGVDGRTYYLRVSLRN